MPVWNEFYKQPRVREHRNDPSALVHLAADFVFYNYKDILAETRRDPRPKVRISHPFKFMSSSTGVIEHTLRAVGVTGLVIVSMAPQWTCQASSFDYLEEITTEGVTGSGYIGVPMSEEFGIWLIRCRPLIEAGFVSYLPMKGLGWWDDTELVEPRHQEIDKLPGDEWQINELARDVQVSLTLGATPLLTTAVRSGLLLDSLRGSSSEFAFATLPTLDTSRVSPTVLTRLRLEEPEAFREFSSSWSEAVKKAAERAASDGAFQAAVADIEQALILEPYLSLRARVADVAASYRTDLLGLLALASTTAAVSVTTGTPSPISGSIGTVTLMYLFQKLMERHRKLGELIRNPDRGYQTRLVDGLTRKGRRL